MVLPQRRVCLSVMLCLFVAVSMLPPSAAAAPSAATTLSGQIAFSDKGNIFVLDLASGVTARITNDGINSDPAWSPDGKLIAFVHRDSSESNAGVYLMNPDGSAVTLINFGADDLLPAWAPDGSLLFISVNHAVRPNLLRIIRINPAGATKMVYETETSLCVPINLSVSPTGVPVLGLDCGRGDYMYSVDESASELIDMLENTNPALSGCADGGTWAHTRPIFAVEFRKECEIGAGHAVYTLDFSSKPTKSALLLPDVGVGSVAWSWDDRLLAYSTSTGLWVRNEQGATQQVSAYGASPTWKPAPSNSPASGNGQAGTTPAYPFFPVTVGGPFSGGMTEGPHVPWLGVSVDWVGYATDVQSCGHCGRTVDQILLKNMASGKKVAIRSAGIAPLSSSGGAAGATDIVLAGNKLIWSQPTGVAPGRAADDKFVPGDFNCARCVYDLNSGKGGAFSGAAPVEKTKYAANAIAATDAAQPDRLLVTDVPGNVYINAALGKKDRLGLIEMGGDKVVFIQRMYDEKSGALLGEFVRMAWVIAQNAAFDKVWTKADGPVKSGQIGRSWLWGPTPAYHGMEAYAEGPGGQHEVLYYDKARMEINKPAANPNDPFYITNGLLTVEMISGAIQVGDNSSVQALVPCTLTVVGDPRKDNPLTPSYAALAGVASLRGDHQAPNRVGKPVSDSLDVNGVVGTDNAHANLAKYATFVAQTGHNIPDVYWTYLQGMQSTYGYDWTFVLGYPITEGYWTTMRVSGKDYPVMIQAFQRRVMTYVPDFAPEWRIQQGNVGGHYFTWRYTLNR